jgi:adenylyltransferase/sulfurtransferase
LKSKEAFFVYHMLNSDELIRYQKQLKLPDWGLEKQLLLQKSNILVVGAGGLASSALMYLAAAGIGHIHIIDGDLVELSNLARQVLFSQKDIGKYKVDVAVQRLSEQNPSISVSGQNEFLNPENAFSLISGFDLVVDCTDSFEARYLINDACVSLNKPFVYAAIHSWEGLMSVCNAKQLNGELGPTYRCLFPEEPGKMEIPTCEEVGVMGFLPGILGLFQAKEVIFYLAGMESKCNGSLMRWDSRDMTFHFFKVQRTKQAESSIFPKKFQADEVREISVTELNEQLAHQIITSVLDVREDYELDLAKLDGVLHIPMALIPQNIHLIPKTLTIAVMCHHGMRSASVIRYLQQEHQFENLYNVTGGIEAWAREVDGSVGRY